MQYSATRQTWVKQGAEAALSYVPSLAVPSRKVLVLGLILSVLQILDGLLTGIGMYHFGTDAEGNILLRSLMESMGYLPALALVKSLAIGVIACLCYLSVLVDWVETALKAVIFVYVFAAIIPWTMILLSHAS